MCRTARVRPSVKKRKKKKPALFRFDKTRWPSPPLIGRPEKREVKLWLFSCAHWRKTRRLSVDSDTYQGLLKSPGRRGLREETEM